MGNAESGNLDAASIDMIETARHRSNMYGLLSLIYNNKISKYLLDQLKEPAVFYVLYNMGADLGIDYFRGGEDELLHELAGEYVRLFSGPERHVPPYESVHHKGEDGSWGESWGKSTVEVKRFIESAGLRYKFEYSGTPDHISVELGFMKEVTKEEALAWENMDIERANYCLQIEKLFIIEHISRWVPGFCDMVIEEARVPFYREMAKVTKRFISFEREEVDNMLSDARK